MAKHNREGEWGETVAQDYLIARGFAIASCDSRLGRKEVDIVAFRGNHIHFVEVKTRSTDFVDPLQAIDARKIRNIVKFADNYIRLYNIRHIPQFDIIAIVGDPDNGVTSLEYIPDAFFAPRS